MLKVDIDIMKKDLKGVLKLDLGMALFAFIAGYILLNVGWLLLKVLGRIAVGALFVLITLSLVGFLI